MLYSSLYFPDSGKSLEEKIVNNYKKTNMKNYFIQLLRKYTEAERKLIQVIWFAGVSVKNPTSLQFFY